MKLFLRVTTALLFIAGIIWLIVDPGFDALTAFLTGILTLIGSFVVDRKPDTETLEHRNRRILLGHVENAWIKGVLDASLHGAALLDLDIKQDPEAVTKYPWAIKKQFTDETLPAGISMLDIFDSVGMERSLLILGAPGSGKTTMLLELARQLIARARDDVSQPIPMIFNLASWTEKLSLADWLAQELNNLYSVPRKTAPDWVKGNKVLLLLDGLDEVRQESRAKCVEAINEFRKAHGWISLAVCSRSQDYADLNTKLSFEGAIEVQLLTQEQIAKFFNRFGDEMAGIKQVLQKDSTLREMAATPLFLSIMIMTYRDKQDVDIWVFKDEKVQRKHLFDTYIERMFERSRSTNALFKKLDILYWLSWLAQKMIEYNQFPYSVEEMQLNWLYRKKQWGYRLSVGLACSLICVPFFGIIGGSIFVAANWIYFGNIVGLILGLLVMLPLSLFCGLIFGLTVGLVFGASKINMVDTFKLNWLHSGVGFIVGQVVASFIGMYVVLLSLLLNLVQQTNLISQLVFGLIGGLIVFGPVLGLVGGILGGLKVKPIIQTTYAGQSISSSIRNFFFFFLLIFLSIGINFEISYMLFDVLRVPNMLLTWLILCLLSGLILGQIGGLKFGGFAVIQHYTLRFLLARNNLLPWKLVLFLDHCVDLIFLRRVGGGYIFVHRLLMEHFAEMYEETTK